ncbi:MAG: hypothetical protein WD063_04995 [Pirellulales bacterium]
MLIVVASHRHAEQDPNDVAPLVKIPLLHVKVIDLPTHQLPGQRQVGFQIIGMRDRLEIGRQQFLLAVAEDLAQRPIYLEKATIQIDQCHADRGVVERAAKGAAFAVKFPLPRRGTLFY